jgi:predicted small lipoprotein YifL
MALLILLSGCGQPGPLYMPKPPTRAAAKATPAPAPAEAANLQVPAATQH